MNMTHHGPRIDPLREACVFLRERRASPNDIDRAHRFGWLSDRGAEAARVLWSWSAPHFTDAANIGVDQDRAFRKLGQARLYRRFERVLALIEKYGH